MLSLFVELGVVALDPIVNENTAGLGDMNVGCKVCLLETNDFLATAQLRVYEQTSFGRRRWLEEEQCRRTTREPGRGNAMSFENESFSTPRKTQTKSRAGRT